MITNSILTPEVLKIIDQNNNIISYGANQEWYKIPRQRQAGCGPSVASNIVLYLTGLDSKLNTKEKFLRLMEESWYYLRPGNRGIPEIKTFCNAMNHI